MNAMQGVDLLLNGFNQGLQAMEANSRVRRSNALADQRRLYALLVMRYNTLATRHNEVLRRLQNARLELAALRRNVNKTS